MAERPPSRPRVAWQEEVGAPQELRSPLDPNQVDVVQPLQIGATLPEENAHLQEDCEAKTTSLRSSPSAAHIIEFFAEDLQPCEKTDVVLVLIEAMRDSSTFDKEAARNMLNMVKRNCDFWLVDVPKITSCIHRNLESINTTPARHSVESLIVEMADKCPGEVVSTLLTIAPPGDRTALALWEVMFSVPQTLQNVLKELHIQLQDRHCRILYTHRDDASILRSAMLASSDLQDEAFAPMYRVSRFLRQRRPTVLSLLLRGMMTLSETREMRATLFFIQARKMKVMLPDLMWVLQYGNKAIKIKALVVFRNVMAQLERKEATPMAVLLAEFLPPFFDDELSQLREISISLFRDLMKVLVGNNKRKMKNMVRLGLLPLFFRMSDQTQSVAKVAREGLLGAAELLKWKQLEHLVQTQQKWRIGECLLEQDRSRAQEFLIQSLPYLMDAQASLREAALRFIVVAFVCKMAERPPSRPRVAWQEEVGAPQELRSPLDPNQVDVVQPLQIGATLPEENAHLQEDCEAKTTSLRSSPSAAHIIEFFAEDLQPCEKTDVVLVLIEAMRDSSTFDKEAARNMLNMVKRNCDFWLVDVPKITSCIHRNLESINTTPARQSVESLIVEMADKCPGEVVSTLLTIAPPGDRTALALWEVMFSVPQTLQNVLKELHIQLQDRHCRILYTHRDDASILRLAMLASSDLQDEAFAPMYRVSRFLRQRRPTVLSLLLRGMMTLSERREMRATLFFIQARKMKVMLPDLMWVLQYGNKAIKIKALVVFRNVMAQLERKEATPMAVLLAEFLPPFFDDELSQLREISISLFRDLMKVLVGNNKRKMKNMVRLGLLPLFFRMSDQTQSVAKVAREGLLGAAELLKWKQLEHLVQTQQKWRIGECLLEQDRSRAQEFLIQSLPYLMDAQASLREAALRFIVVAFVCKMAERPPIRPRLAWQERPPSRPRVAWQEEVGAPQELRSPLDPNQVDVVQPLQIVDAGWLPTSEVEQEHMDSIVSFVSSPEKDEEQKMEFFQCIAMIFKGATYNDLAQGLDLFCQRYELAENNKVLLEEEPRDQLPTVVQRITMFAMAEMSFVEEVLEGKDMSLIRACFSSIFLLPPKEEMRDLKPYLYFMTMKAVDSMLVVLVLKSPASEVSKKMQDIFQMLLTLTTSERACVRERAVGRIRLLSFLLANYSSLKADPDEDRNGSYVEIQMPILGQLLGHLLLFLSFKEEETSCLALDALCFLFQFKHQQHCATLPEENAHLQEDCEAKTTSLRSSPSAAHIIEFFAEDLQPCEKTDVVLVLIEAMRDSSTFDKEVARNMLNMVKRNCDFWLVDVPKITSCIHRNLESINTTPARQSVESLIVEMADKCPGEVVSTLLTIAPPGDRTALALWEVMFSVPQTLQNVLKELHIQLQDRHCRILYTHRDDASILRLAMLASSELQDEAFAPMYRVSRFLRQRRPTVLSLLLRGMMTLSERREMRATLFFIQARKMKVMLPDLMWVLQYGNKAIKIKALVVFRNVMAQLERKEATPMAVLLAEFLPPFFDDELSQLREISISLFRDLMKVLVGNNKRKMKNMVRLGLLPLFFRMSDQTQSVAKVAREGLLGAAELLKWKQLEHLVQTQQKWRIGECLLEQDRSRAQEFLIQSLPYLMDAQASLREAALRCIVVAFVCKMAERPPIRPRLAWQERPPSCPRVAWQEEVGAPQELRSPLDPNQVDVVQPLQIGATLPEENAHLQEDCEAKTTSLRSSLSAAHIIEFFAEDLQPCEKTDVVLVLIEAMRDSSTFDKEAARNMLNMVKRNCDFWLVDVPKITSCIHRNLESINTTPARQSVESLIVEMADKCPGEVVSTLLTIAPPGDRTALALWEVMFSVPQTLQNVLKELHIQLQDRHCRILYTHRDDASILRLAMLASSELQDEAFAPMYRVSRFLRQRRPTVLSLLLRGMMTLSERREMRATLFFIQARKMKVMLPDLMWVLQYGNKAIKIKALVVFRNVMAQLERKEATPMAVLLAEFLPPFFDDELSQLREISISLFRDLMKVLVGNNKRKMKNMVRLGLLPLFFRMSDQTQSVAKVAREGLLGAAELLKWKQLEHLVQTQQKWRIGECLLEQDRSRAQEFLIQSLPYLMDAQASLREAALRFIAIQPLENDSEPSICFLATQTIVIVRSSWKRPRPRWILRALCCWR
ncbi:hypothetical protein Q9233_010760 [Columba guinea]|nr:hypothetical protein Q9233_010760 [Columba guinea]